MTKSVYRVAIADDLRELRALLRRAIERTGRFEVCAEAENGLEAVVIARNEQPDLLLLDVSMPLCDGLEALPQIREAAPDTTVVMLSGFEANRLARLAMERGAAGYIEKGIRPNDLVATLLEVLGDSGPDGTDPVGPEG